MLKIRLMRIGAKKRPFYRVVVVDERAKRTGGYIENLGTYNPLTEPKEIKLKKDRIDYWLKRGAQKSDGFLRIIGEAPQRPPRKPKRPSDGGKKEKKVEEPAAPAQPTAEQPAEAPAAEPPKTEEPQKEEAAEVVAETPKEETKNEGSA